MATKKTRTKTVDRDRSRIIVDRPIMPPEYGLPKNKTGLLDWSYVQDQMTKAMHYWICTVTPDQRPHATPVDGLWLDDRLYFGGSSQSRWHRNLKTNPAVEVHLENAMQLLILRGEAHELNAPARELTARLSTASAHKYGFGLKPEQYEQGGVYVFQPRVVIAWKNFPKDATRWRFPNME
jgi:nitroimidazol reductase NimA-like FMN-containing flavoprotein (pyridoxamine 5'-phosphate oxidase superfamily)